MAITMKKIKSYIPTIIISILIPFFYYSFNYMKTETVYEIIFDVVYCISAWIFYYKIVSEKRKTDIDTKNRIKRLLFSFTIQLIICGAVFLFPLIRDLNQPLEKGHHTPIEMLFLPIIIILEPVLNHLWCFFVSLIIIRIPRAIYKKIKANRE